MALSCGGQIASNPARKDDTLVLNVFTSEGKGQSALFDSVNLERTAEDRSAWESLGVKTRSLDLPEALLRKEFPFRFFRGTDQNCIIEKLCDAVDEYARLYKEAEFTFPAGFGNHVDHLACKAAAFRLLDQRRLSKISLYEDVPYSWLRFIREQTYRVLGRSIEFGREGRAVAFRPDGSNLLDYVRRRVVPFPRGKKLFPAVYVSLLLENLSASAGHTAYCGRIKTFALNADQVSAKRRLLEHYQSQLPMLFGNSPDQLFEKAHSLLSREVTIEVVLNAAPTG